MKLSETIKNKDFRIDSDFWTKEPYKNLKLRYEKIGKILKKAQYGISISMNEDKKGYPIYRMNEIHNMLTDLDVDKYANMTREEFLKFKLKDRDVLFNRTNSYEWVGRTGIYRQIEKQEFTFASYLVRFIPDETSVNPEYLTVYLNTKYGILDIKRRSRQSINQTNVNPEEVKEIYLPILDNSIQIKIKECFDKAHINRLKSKRLYQQAENILLESLGLKYFQPNTDPINIKSFKDSFGSTGRLDAEYYHPKYAEEDKMIEKYPCGFVFFKELVLSYEKGKLMDYSEEYSDNISKPYILINNLRGEDYLNYTTSQHGVLCSKDDFLIVGDGSNSGYVGTDLEGYVGSTLIKIKLKNNIEINKYSILCILRHYYEKINFFKTGSGVPHLDKTILDNLRIPILEKSIQNIIASLFEESFRLKKQSELLLETAKEAVEIAIEKDEEKALSILNGMM